MTTNDNAPALIKDASDFERATGEYATITAVENTPEYHAWVRHFNTCVECQHWSVCTIGSDMLAIVTSGEVKG